MHDPLSVAFEVRNPFGKKRGLGTYVYRPPLLTIWHRDPCKGGSDDSCDWFYRHIDKATREYLRYPDGLDFPCSEDEFEQRCIGFRLARKRLKPRPWWRQTRWHFYHWRFQLHPWQKFVNEHFTRCSICHEKMGKAARYSGWEGNAVWHDRCGNQMARPIQT